MCNSLVEELEGITAELGESVVVLNFGRVLAFRPVFKKAHKGVYIGLGSSVRGALVASYTVDGLNSILGASNS